MRVKAHAVALMAGEQRLRLRLWFWRLEQVWVVGLGLAAGLLHPVGHSSQFQIPKQKRKRPL